MPYRARPASNDAGQASTRPQDISLEVRCWFFCRELICDLELEMVAWQNVTVHVGTPEGLSFPQVIEALVQLPIGIEKAGTDDASPAFEFYCFIKDHEVRQAGAGIEGSEKSGELQPI